MENTGWKETLKSLDPIRYRYTLSLLNAISAKDQNLAKTLIEKGAEVNFKLKSNQTLLMAAVIMRDPEIVRLLLTKGANVNVRGDYGQTAYTLALQTKCADIIHLLKDAGATYTLIDRLNLIKNTVLQSIRGWFWKKRVDDLLNTYSK